jgi:perosamine synthetase
MDSPTMLPAENASQRIETGLRSSRFVPSFPTLWPHMLFMPRAAAVLPFPFAEASTRYYFLARYGIYDVARSWGLSGKEVLFPAYFHSVELDALLAAGAQVRFYPVHRELRVDVDEVARMIGPRTAAVYVIHYGGFPGPIQALAALCRERGIRLIEDAALALLSKVDDRPLGSFGDAGIFCLYKTIPTPTGGAVVMPSGWPASLAEPRPFSAVRAGVRAGNLILLNLEMRGITGSRQLRQIGQRLRRLRRGAESPHRVRPGSTFDRSLIGLGVGPFARRVIQHQDYSSIIARRRHNYLRLVERLGSVLPPIFTDLPAGLCPLFYPFQTGHREQLLQAVRARGAEIGEFWPEQHPMIPPGAFPEVDQIRKTALWLPCHQDLNDESIDALAAVVLQARSQIE